MANLIAQGPESQQRWRRTLPEGKRMILGRSAECWVVPWDEQISRQHVELCWRQGKLDVRKFSAARNPVFLNGSDVEQFAIEPGQHFVIGRTTFTLSDERVSLSLDVPHPMTEQTFGAQYLRQLRLSNDQRLDVLRRLPDVISGASSDVELFVRLVNLLLTGMPRAAAVALVAVHAPGAGQPGDVEILHWDRRFLSGEDFRPSERLIRQAVARGESVLHAWSDASAQRAPTTFTQAENVDWAFCTPVPGDACQGWAFYVTGHFVEVQRSEEPSSAESQDLLHDLKFTELAASTLTSLRQLRLLEQSRSSLKQFFSPIVLEALSGQDPDVVLAPREAEVSVMFCDLRGFTRRSERAASDLLGLLHRVSQALGVMTHHILDQGGVVGDFHGDAAMGFWGWPLTPDQPIERACLAALGIRSEFVDAAQQPDHPLSDFRMGIGISTGIAVAGKIGTVDQVKVTVFGPVVNLAARLETMTKTLRASILLDEQTAGAVRACVPREVARVRRVARVRPQGLLGSLEVSQLLPPEDQYPQLTDEHIEAYEAALDALLAGDWSQAFRLLHSVPAEDRVKDFLTVFIAQHNRTPPENWDGVIPL